MSFDMATLNTRVGLAAEANSSLGWFRDNTKPNYRSYGLQNMAGYYYYQSNISGGFGGAYNCTVFHSALRPPGYDNCRYSLYQYVAINCCQDGNPTAPANCNCNCISNCGNCSSFGGVTGPYAAGEGQCDQCAQCTIGTNCDSRSWLQPNCNCAQCNCACNCYGAGQCVVTNCNCG